MMRYCRTANLLSLTVLLPMISGVASAGETKATLPLPAYVSSSYIADSLNRPIAPEITGSNRFGRSTGSTILAAQVTGTLLSPEQKAQLTQLPIPVVVPTVLPATFRLVRAEGEAGTYTNGDDDSGYAIDYQGEKNTCLSIRTSQDGPRGLEKVKQVQTRFGLITVYTEKSPGSKSLVSFLGLKGNPMLISGGAQPDSTTSTGWKRCQAVSVEAYTQVLQSLTVLK
ncbi:MAG: hypothetical protein ACAF41_06075 [Leptolyngbya sp. BL-A-14]